MHPYKNHYKINNLIDDSEGFWKPSLKIIAANHFQIKCKNVLKSLWYSQMTNASGMYHPDHKVNVASR